VCDKPDFCHADEEAGNTMQKARALSMLPTPNRFFCERKKAIIRKSVSPASILTKEKDQGRGVWSVSKHPVCPSPLVVPVCVVVGCVVALAIDLSLSMYPNKPKKKKQRSSIARFTPGCPPSVIQLRKRKHKDI